MSNNVFIIPDGSRLRPGGVWPIVRSFTRIVPAQTEIGTDGNERVVAPLQEVTESQSFNISFAALDGMSAEGLAELGVSVAQEGVKPDARAYEFSEGQIVDGVVTYTRTPRPIEPLKNDMRSGIKIAARALILARYPDWKQANMTARAVELTLKRAGGEQWSDAEATEAAGLQAAWDWIKAVRAHSDVLEQAVAALRDNEAVLAFEPAGWPD